MCTMKGILATTDVIREALKFVWDMPEEKVDKCQFSFRFWENKNYDRVYLGGMEGLRSTEEYQTAFVRYILKKRPDLEFKYQTLEFGLGFSESDKSSADKEDDDDDEDADEGDGNEEDDAPDSFAEPSGEQHEQARSNDDESEDDDIDSMQMIRDMLDVDENGLASNEDEENAIGTPPKKRRKLNNKRK